jgi:hypothetical protein
MLKAGVSDDFKGATTLLLWGDAEGMTLLGNGLDALRTESSASFSIDGPAGGITIVQGDGSMLTDHAGALCWRCSPETVDMVGDLTRALIGRAGHQFMDVSGLAEQVIIARDEYPANLP